MKSEHIKGLFFQLVAAVGGSPAAGAYLGVSEQRVRQLYARHNLDQTASRRPAAMVSLVLSRRKKRVEAAESMIVSILTEFFFVRAVYLDRYDLA